MLDVEITHRVFVDRRLDALNLILRVEGGVDAVLAEHGDRHHVHLLGDHDRAIAAFLDLLPPPERDRIRTGQPGGLEEPRRVQPQIQLVALGILRWNGHRRPVAVDVPGVLAVDDVGLMHVLLKRGAVHPAEAVLPRCGIQAWLAIECLLAGPGFPIDGARVVGHRVDSRPIDVGGLLEGLAHRAVVASA
jgi:hypothetical protein